MAVGVVPIQLIVQPYLGIVFFVIFHFLFIEGEVIFQLLENNEYFCPTIERVYQ